MNVRELIDILKEYDDNTEVHFTYISGDYWRTQVTNEVRSVFESKVYWTEYHRQYALVNEVEEDYLAEERSDKPNKTVLILE